jgi:hypothetical protein
LDKNCRQALNGTLPPPPVSRLFKRAWKTFPYHFDILRYRLDHESSSVQFNSTSPEVRYSWRKDKCSGFQLSGPTRPRLGVSIATVISLLYGLILAGFILLKLCRTYWKTDLRTEHQRTKCSSGIQHGSGLYQPWVPDFVVRSASTFINTAGVGQKVKRFGQSSSFEINTLEPAANKCQVVTKNFDDAPSTPAAGASTGYHSGVWEWEWEWASHEFKDLFGLLTLNDALQRSASITFTGSKNRNDILIYINTIDEALRIEVVNRSVHLFSRISTSLSEDMHMPLRTKPSGNPLLCLTFGLSERECIRFNCIARR